jgi:hypothetical protein
LFSSSEIAGAVMVIFNIIFNLAIFWIILALMFKKKINNSTANSEQQSNIEKVSHLLCKHCMAQVSENDIYCQKCGIKISQKSTSFLGGYSGFTKVTIFLVSVILFLSILYIVREKETIQSDPLSPSYLSDETQSTSDDVQEKMKEWIEYDSVNGRFKILFPDWPSHDSGKATTEDPFDYDTYSTVFPNGTEYATFIYKYIQEFDSTQEDATLEVFANSVKTMLAGELVESTYITFKGYRALDFVVYTWDDDSYFHGVVFLRDNHTAYSLAVLYKSENKSEAQFEKFTDSFTLK